MRNLYLFSFILFASILTSCAPQITKNISKTNAIIVPASEIKVLGETDSIPKNAEDIGIVKVGDTEITTNCTYEVVLTAAKKKASNAGGNAIKIVEHKMPDGWSSCHRITARILRIEKIETTFTETNQLFTKDTIAFKKLESGITKLSYKNKYLSMKELTELLKTNRKATLVLNQAKGSIFTINVLSFIGGGFIGYPLGMALAGNSGDGNASILATVGISFCLVTIPISIASSKRIAEAIEIYNNNIKQQNKKQE